MPGRLRGLLLAPPVNTLLVITLLVTALLAGSVAADAADPVPKYKKALRIARHQIGDPYKYGAEGPNRFDCSGLVYYSTHKAGLTNVPRTSAEQADYMRRIPRKDLHRGDYVFFTGSSGVYHVGLFVGRKDGDVYIVHAPQPGTKVRRERVWTSSWFAGTLRR
jgi:cell wall-associated NlpC family hydrolase